MNKRLILILTLATLLTFIFTSCAQQKKEILPSQMASVTRDDLILSVSSDGNLDMPNQVQLKFGTPGTVRDIPAERYKLRGKPVKAGTLLASLDNTTQLLTVQAAQYALEQAINSVVQTCCGSRYPTFYSLATALLRFEQAQTEIADAKTHLANEQYYLAASDLSLAKYDLIAARSVYANPKLDTFQTQFNQIDNPLPLFPELAMVISALDNQIQSLGSLQALIEKGDYPAALVTVNDLSDSMLDVHTTVKQNSRLPGTYTYPDTSTSLAIARQVLDSLSEAQSLLNQDNIDRVQMSEKLRMAQHDLLMSNMILDESETLYRAGLSPQTLRNYNINIETALINLNKAKQELLKTEIIAPFDGTIVAVDIKVNDQLSQFDYSSKTAVYLVDTKTVRMTGVIDEIDITKVKVDQQAILTIDALPGQKINGHVTFVSPFGTLQAGVVNFPVEIYIDPTENATNLRGGLTATADIVIGKKTDVIQVPNRAIKGLAGDYWVDVVTNAAAATTQKRPVKIGLQNKRMTEVISGLQQGEKVLVEAIK